MTSSRITLIWRSLLVLVVVVGCGQQENTDIDQPDDRTAGSALMLEQLTYPQIDQLDRDKSIFILTFGNLEEHGPHIPIGSDTYQAVADGISGF